MRTSDIAPLSHSPQYAPSLVHTVHRSHLCSAHTDITHLYTGITHRDDSRDRNPTYEHKVTHVIKEITYLYTEIAPNNTETVTRVIKDITYLYTEIAPNI